MDEITTSSLTIAKPPVDSSALQLSSIQVDTEYCKKWNERMTDFVVLTKNGELVSNSLYRVGGMGCKPDGKNYFMLLKYVEDYYPADILKMSGNKDPKHLSGRWCIIDKNGIEKVVFESFKSPYLMNDSCIYSIDQNYYNIETGKHYCKAYTSMKSKDFLFLENAYDDDKSRRGVIKVCKKTGTWELFV
jgi:hypothetical protein